MKTIQKVTLLSVALLFVAGTLIAEEAKKADEAKKIDLSKAKCLVSGKDVSPDATADYKGAKVYFCCPGCPGAFAKDTKKYAAKANHQLALTGQAKQKACPLSGKPTTDGTELKVAGIAVSFCCNNCQKAASSKKDDAQIDLVFGEEAFKKAYEVVKADKKEG
jgi:hypothetical protein